MDIAPEDSGKDIHQRGIWFLHNTTTTTTQHLFTWGWALHTGPHSMWGGVVQLLWWCCKSIIFHLLDIHLLLSHHLRLSSSRVGRKISNKDIFFHGQKKNKDFFFNFFLGVRWKISSHLIFINCLIKITHSILSFSNPS
jgi:hypothetical protein